MNRWHSLPAEVYALVEHTPETVLLESAKTTSASDSHFSRLFTSPLRLCIANDGAELSLLFAQIESSVAAGHFAAGYFAYECGRIFEPSAAAHPIQHAQTLTTLQSPSPRSQPPTTSQTHKRVSEPPTTSQTHKPVSGHDFSRAVEASESARALAPEGCPASTSSAVPAVCPAQPLAWIGIYDRCYLFDHRTGIFVGDEPPGLAHFRSANADQPSPDPDLETALALTEQHYAQRIAAIHEWILSGDVYQLNFTIPIQVRAHSSSAALYAHLRSRQPAPYGAFLHTQPDRRILSFSPELFFRIEESKSDSAFVRTITTRPMKGTAPRGRTTSEDRALADWLRNDPKNRSENVMIVDLLRNDLGRLCKYGTVRAENLFAIERYPTLTQMTSTVTGELRAEVDFHQIFRALFPCGSITGAPKIRAMQLLSLIEQQPRGVYTGAIGFFSKHQSIFNVAIRTLELEDGRGSIGVGSGIVIDSDPATEFRECLLKAEFLTGPSAPHLDPLQQFSLIETLLWHNGFPLIELHLDRLEDSAGYFGFPCNRAEVKAALLTHAATLRQPLGAPSIPHLLAEWVGNQESQSAEIPHKVRLLLSTDGDLHISSEILQDSTSTHPARLYIASQRTDPIDPMYFHKTTHRPIYAQALKAATEAGFDDVLFLNLRGEVTEGAIHNIFVERYGCLYTPPIECGLLAGVYRRHLLESRTDVREKILHIEDIHNADAIYLSNAVRGLRSAIIDWQAD
jgi:para-aminobenzoate synthetase/4-amino-4-deoxychorismate lyase